jgi:DNA-binding beta-propeller fold protein YncE
MKIITLTIVALFLQIGLFAQSHDSLCVWPPPPDQARIKHIQTILSLADFKHEGGFFSKLFNFFAGAERRSQWFVQPVGIAVSPNGRIVVTDPGASCVHIIDIKEKDYKCITETKFGKFTSPVGVAFAEDGTMYVSDSQRGDVVIFDSDFDADHLIKGDIKRPTGLAVVGDKLYVVDTGDHQIKVFNRRGEYLSSFGKHGNGYGEFNYPLQLAVRDSIVVLDGLNYRVQTFDVAGKFGSTFGRQGNIAGRFAGPKGIALDSDDNIYVTDALMDNFQIFSKNGQLLLIVGTHGKLDGQFMNPGGICIDRNDKIYVVETLNKRIQIFQYLK